MFLGGIGDTVVGAYVSHLCEQGLILTPCLIKATLVMCEKISYEVVDSLSWHDVQSQHQWEDKKLTFSWLNICSKFTIHQRNHWLPLISARCHSIWKNFISSQLKCLEEKKQVKFRIVLLFRFLSEQSNSAAFPPQILVVQSLTDIIFLPFLSDLFFPDKTRGKTWWSHKRRKFHWSGGNQW